MYDVHNKHIIIIDSVIVEAGMANDVIEYDVTSVDDIVSLSAAGVQKLSAFVN